MANRRRASTKIRVVTAWPAKERLRRYWRSLNGSAGKGELWQTNRKFQDLRARPKRLLGGPSKQEDRIDDALEEAAARGELGRGTAVRRAALPTTTIRLDPKDIERARIQAEWKGLRYQTYLKMLLHEALRAHESAS